MPPLDTGWREPQAAITRAWGGSLLHAGTPATATHRGLSRDMTDIFALAVGVLSSAREVSFSFGGSRVQRHRMLERGFAHAVRLTCHCRASTTNSGSSSICSIVHCRVRLERLLPLSGP